MRLAQSFTQCRGEGCFLGAERERKPSARAHDVADKLGAFGADGAKPDRFRIAVEDRGNVDQVDRSLVHHAVAPLDEQLDETAQAKFLGVSFAHDALGP
jgi:hypothetical protein